MTMSHLHHIMPNGATVKDWLGTAATAAHVGAADIERVREGQPFEILEDAEAMLTHAIEEIRVVREAFS